MLPYFVVLAIVTAAMGLGAEITAGEKEKKTISTLLVSQLSRLEIVLGKFLAVLAVGTIAAVLSVIGLVYGLSFFGLQIDLNLIGDPFVFLALILTLIPLVGILSSIVIIVGTFARTQKEANVYQTPIYMIVIITGILSTSGGLALEGPKYFIPLLNALEVFKELLSGSMVSQNILYTFLSNLAFASLLLIVSVRLFKKETILFRN